jgi:exodeoxyribonuclease VII small subunit
MAKKKSEKAADQAGALSFEKQLARLEEIVEKLEGEMPGLDESIKLYEEGVKSLKACQQKLEGAEARIKMLVEGKGGQKLEDFDAAEAGEADRGGDSDEDDSPPPSRRRKARKPRGRGLF